MRREFCVSKLSERREQDPLSPEHEKTRFPHMKKRDHFHLIDLVRKKNLRPFYSAGTKATRTNMHSLRGAINNDLNVTNVRLLLCQRTTGNL